MKILVLAPHPDDEVLGCGGTIRKHVEEGHEVFVCIGTKAYAPDWSEEFLKERPEEIKKAHEILGVKKTYFLDFPTVKMNTIPQKEVNDAFIRVVRDVNPDIVYIPHLGDLHGDHQILAQAGLVGTRPLPGSSIRKVIAFESTHATEWGSMIKPFVPNMYVDIETAFPEKLKAMEAYKSEVKEYPHPRSLEGLKILAQKRGLECGLKFAEAFMVIREIV